MAWIDLFRGGRKSNGTLEIFRELYGRLWSTKSGRSVTLDTAVQVSAFFACNRLIANGMAQVPLKLMREAPNGRSRKPAKDHPLYDVLALNPNPWQTSFDFRAQWSWHVETAGNFVCFKNAPAGVVRELIPLDPMRTKITQLKDYSLKYEVTGDDGTTREIPQEAIFHVKGASWNGWKGMASLQVAREALGLAMDTEEAQSALHRNGVRPSGVYSVTGKLNGDQYKELRAWIEREAAGAAKTGAPLILDREAKWLSTQMTGVDAQTNEIRRQQIEEVCRFMGVLPIMVGHTGDKAATYASAEQMFLAHIVHTLSPRWTAYEQVLDKYLLTPQERAAGLYFDFVEEGMIRGSIKDTKDAILGFVNGGVMTPNEGRAKLDLDADDDPASDKLRIPVNTAQEPKPSEDPSASPPAA